MTLRLTLDEITAHWRRSVFSLATISILTGDDQYSYSQQLAFLLHRIKVTRCRNGCFESPRRLFWGVKTGSFSWQDRLLWVTRQVSVGGKTGSFSWQNNHLYETGASLDRRQRNYCIPAVRLLLTKTNVTKGPFTVFTIHSLIFVPLPEKTCAGSVNIYYYI